MRQHHVTGEKLFLDFCGPTIPVINADTRGSGIFVTSTALHIADLAEGGKVSGAERTFYTPDLPLVPIIGS